MLPTEIVQECRYHIVEHFYTTFDIEIQGILIFDSCSQKYNFYVLGYIETSYPPNPCQIIKCHKAQPLEVAQAAFGSYNLDPSTYGF